MTPSATAPPPAATAPPPADSPVTSDAVFQVTLGEEFRLAVGQLARVEQGVIAIEFLTVVSGLSNGCAKFDDTYGQRVDYSAIVVQVINSMPTDPDVACTEEYSTVENRLALGGKFELGKTCTVNINDKVETFAAQ